MTELLAVAQTVGGMRRRRGCQCTSKARSPMGRERSQFFHGGADSLHVRAPDRAGQPHSAKAGERGQLPASCERS
jgi:hypothetical protein